MYQKTTISTKLEIDEETKHFAKELKIGQKMEQYTDH